MDLGLIHIDQPSGDDDIVNVTPAGFGKDGSDVKANMPGGDNFFCRFYIRHEFIPEKKPGKNGCIFFRVRGKTYQ
jgi:hypothetical protein